MESIEPIQQGHVFRITPGSGIWRVSRDGAFFGDYLTHGNAVRAACAGARIDENRGRVALVFEPPGVVALRHHEPHLGV